MRRSELVLLVLDPLLVRTRKKEPNHRVGKQPLDEPVDDPSQDRFAA
jgi:hypothetical protein